MAAVDGYGALDIGQVTQRTFQVLSRNAAPFLGLAVLFVGLPALVSGLINLGHPRTPSFDPANLAFGFVMWLVRFFFDVLLQACIVIASVADLKGRRPSIADSLRHTVGFILPASAITLLAGLGIGFGFVLLIVPGAMLATMWAVVIPAAVIEKTGVFGAFRRSRALTRGNRWRIFALLAVYFIVLFALQWTLLAMVGFTIRAGSIPVTTWPMLLFGTLLGVAGGVVGAVGVSSIYFELRAAGDGMDLEDLAAVFA